MVGSYENIKHHEGEQLAGIQIGRKNVAAQLEKEPVPMKFTYRNVEYKGEGIPVPGTCINGVCYDLDIHLNGRHVGMLHRLKNNWKMDGVEDEKFVNMIGDIVMLWYE